MWMNSLEFANLETVSSHFRTATSGTIILFWHNRLFPMIGALNRSGSHGRKVYGLVSASRDGGQLSFFMESLGISVVRGSSSRRGAVAARELVKALKAGQHVAITVDGPRGPCYTAQEGAAFLVQLTGAPVVLFGAEFESCHELGSWDRFVLPKPFSRVNIKTDHLTLDSRQSGKGQREVIQDLIQQKLSDLTGDYHREA
jgi:lysophospholipid acyltransferase (LPLAT)-like uncharacterized protein